jgi:signal transduction histidine kinase
MNGMDDIKLLKEENEKLKKINGIKSDLISISAHQLRTSLSAMKWMLKMFLDGDLGELSAEQKGLIKKSFDGNERMIQFVNEMLSVNHADDAEISYKMENKNIVPLIESAIFDFTGESFKKGVALIFLKPEEETPNVMMDEEKMRVVFQNLIENAIKYSKEGDKVFISINKKDDGIEISFKDAGIGIPENEKNKIFEKFFRASNAKEKDPVGSGLGLYTVKSIVEKHKGAIRFESDTAGATFFVFLPFSK